MTGEPEVSRRTLCFIIHGEDCTITLPLGATLRMALRLALRETRNTGRSWTEWEPYDQAGRPLSLAMRMRDFPPGQGHGNVIFGREAVAARIFLCLRVGVGGGLPLSGEPADLATKNLLLPACHYQWQGLSSAGRNGDAVVRIHPCPERDGYSRGRQAGHLAVVSRSNG